MARDPVGLRQSRGFNEAMIFRPWKDVAVPSSGAVIDLGFNEAMIFRPWKEVQLQQVRQCGLRFNEAMIFRPWKEASASSDAAPVDALQ